MALRIRLPFLFLLQTYFSIPNQDPKELLPSQASPADEPRPATHAGGSPDERLPAASFLPPRAMPREKATSLCRRGLPDLREELRHPFAPPATVGARNISCSTTRHGTPPLLSIPSDPLGRPQFVSCLHRHQTKGRIQLLETLIISFKFIGYQKSSDPLNPYARFMLAPISTVETGGDESGVQLAIWLSCSA
ncbi:hypothetical protein EJB05_52856, partial [Eragrostis curvula]